VNVHVIKRKEIKMKLEDIGFYTLSDERASKVSFSSQMKRGEIIITDKCNFKCPYCRGIKEELKGDMSFESIKKIIDIWSLDQLENIRFSGGEPTLHKDIYSIIEYAKNKNIKRIALSTNGSNFLENYKKMISCGVNDFSISLDACCSSTGSLMCGGLKNVWERVCNNIRELSKLTYVTVGIVVTDQNVDEVINTIKLAHNLGVADIRVISSAQSNLALDSLKNIAEHIRESHPILNYRLKNIEANRNIRGINQNDSSTCSLVLDDSAILNDYHFPCIIYLREQGKPIGKVNSNMRSERIEWFKTHNTHTDIICRKNCLDVCVDHNNKVASCLKK
jgi:molybdenum cofactor biosynthesis enzyme MoaA